jgi:hypothetical protein
MALVATAWQCRGSLKMGPVFGGLPLPVPGVSQIVECADFARQSFHPQMTGLGADTAWQRGHPSERDS